MLKNNLLFSALQKEFSTISVALNPFFANLLQYLAMYKGIFIAVLIFILVVWIGFHLIKLYLFWNESNKPVTIFEVSPPTTTEQSSFTTTQLFTSIHGLLRQRSWIFRLFDVTKSYSFEIVSTKEMGIRYLLRIAADDSQIIKKSLISYLPGIRITKVDDYVQPQINAGHVLTIQTTNHFAFPLKKQDNLKEYDPIAYVTGTMTKLSENEMVAVQLVVSPVNQMTT